MSIRVSRLFATFVVSVGIWGCATAGSGNSGANVANEAEKTAVSALASQLGVSGNYVSLAVTTAKSVLGSGEKTPEQKAAAAQQGVEKAAAQAKTDGNVITDQQKTTLVDGIKGLL
jgi:hypothetical protein